MTTDADIRSKVRRAAVVIALGAAVYIAGDLFDVAGLVFNPYDLQDAAERVAALEADQTAWGISHLLAGVGHVIAAFGLWLLGRALASASSDRRSQVAATISGWAGLATGVWAVQSYFAVIRPPVEVVAALEDPTADIIVTGLIYVVSALVLFVSLGLTMLRLRHQRWLGWTIMIIGPLAVLSVLGAGPSLPSVLMLLLGLAISIKPYPPAKRAPLQ